MKREWRDGRKEDKKGWEGEGGGQGSEGREGRGKGSLSWILDTPLAEVVYSSVADRLSGASPSAPVYIEQQRASCSHFDASATGKH